MEPLIAPLLLVSEGLLVAQSAVNVQLRRALGDRLTAAATRLGGPLP